MKLSGGALAFWGMLIGGMAIAVALGFAGLVDVLAIGGMAAVAFILLTVFERRQARAR